MVISTPASSKPYTPAFNDLALQGPMDARGLFTIQEEVPKETPEKISRNVG